MPARNVRVDSEIRLTAPWDSSPRARRVQFSDVKIFQELRRRKRPVAAVIVPVVMAVWLSASASACPGMAADSVGHARVDADHPAGDHSALHDHMGHAPQSHSADDTQPARDGPSHHHAGCPHCPPSFGGSSPGPMATHVVCALVDDAADSAAQPSIQKSALEHVMPAVPLAYVTPLDVRHPGFRSLPSAAPVYRSVALNLRHCVFLI